MDLLQIDESSYGFSSYNLMVSTRYAHKMDSYPIFMLIPSIFYYHNEIKFVK